MGSTYWFVATNGSRVSWTKQRALKFLSEHQPLPPDWSDEWTDELLHDVRTLLEWIPTTPDSDLLPGLLELPGEGTGLGLYSLLDDALEEFEPSCVRDCIVVHLSKTEHHQENLGHVLEFAFSFEDERYTPHLLRLLPEMTPDNREWTGSIFEELGSSAIPHLAGMLLREQDPVVRERLREALTTAKKQTR